MQRSKQPLLAGLWFILWTLFQPVCVAAEQHLLKQSTHKALSSAQSLMEQQQYSTAESKLKSLLQTTKGLAYDQAVVQQTLGYLYSKRKQYSKASAAFNKALSSQALPNKVAHNLRYNLAQLLIADAQYGQGTKLLAAWIKADGSPPNSARVLLASAYYQAGNYGQAAKYIGAAIQRDKSPSEDWYKMLVSSQLKSKQYKSAIPTLEKLITRYPHRQEYWQQLTGLYSQQDKQSSALAVQLLAGKLDLDMGMTVSNLADMYRAIGIPYKAGGTLEGAMDKGILKTNYKNLQRLAESWIAAKEAQKAVATLKRLSPMDSSGYSELKQGRVFIGIAAWQDAISPLKASLKKLTGKPVGEANLLLGLATFHQGDAAGAKGFFLKAGRFEQVRAQAGQWIRHIEQQESTVQDDELEAVDEKLLPTDGE